MENLTPDPTPQQPSPVPLPNYRLIASEEILRGEHEVLIAHGQEVYRLRLTRAGKLLLQK